MFASHHPQYIEFISLLRKARKAKRVSQAELGVLLGKPQTFVSKVETCERRLDLVETAEWCVALGISLDDVLPSELKAAMAKVQKSIERPRHGNHSANQ